MGCFHEERLRTFPLACLLSSIFRVTPTSSQVYSNFSSILLNHLGNRHCYLKGCNNASCGAPLRNFQVSDSIPFTFFLKTSAVTTDSMPFVARFHSNMLSPTPLLLTDLQNRQLFQYSLRFRPQRGEVRPVRAYRKRE